jgi:two-component system response regulator AtoC
MGNKSLKAICDDFIFKTEKKLLKRALETTNWNRKKAAALLRISYKSMLNKMKMYEII